MLRLGGQLRAAPSLRYVPLEARALGYNLAQIHVGDAQGWEPYGLSDEDVEQFRRNMFGVELYVHMPYILNPCESDRKKLGFQKLTAKRFYRAAGVLGAKAVVLHPGSHKGVGDEEASKLCAEMISWLLSQGHETEILLETDAGGGTHVGSPEWIARTIDRAKNRDIDSVAGMCLDTEHMWARGVDLWNHEILLKLLYDHRQHLRLVHLNAPDQGVELGSHRDRHNCTFKSFGRDEETAAMITTLAKRLPLVLERSSLGVQKEDAELVQSLVPSE